MAILVEQKPSYLPPVNQANQILDLIREEMDQRGGKCAEPKQAAWDFLTDEYVFCFRHPEEVTEKERMSFRKAFEGMNQDNYDPSKALLRRIAEHSFTRSIYFTEIFYDDPVEIKRAETLRRLANQLPNRV